MDFGAMGLVSLIVLGFTAVCLLFSLILGAARGAKRSVLRLFIVAACGVAAFFLRGPFLEKVKGINIGGQTIAAAIEGFVSGGEVPEGLADVINALVDIIISLGCYLAIFLVLQIVTWIIIFPLFKAIFFGSDKLLKYRGERINNHRFAGMLIGLIQGALVAFLIVAPVNGLLVKANELSKVEVDGRPVVTLPEELKLDEYSTSYACNIYTTVGGWYFDILTQGEDLSLSDAVDAVVVSSQLAAEISVIMNDMESFSIGVDGISAENAATLKESFDKLDSIIDNMTEGSKDLINSLVKDVAQAVSGDNSEVDDISEYIPEDFDIGALDFGAMGDAVVAVASANDTGDMSAEDAAKIVDALIKNEIVLNVLEDNAAGALLSDANLEVKYSVEQAINDAEVSVEMKNKLRNLLLAP